MARLILIGVAVVIGLLVAVFTVDKKEVASFNNQIVKDMERMDSGFKDFDANLVSYFEGDRANLDSLRTALHTLSSNTEGFLTKVKSMTVPDADSCRALHTGVVNYMDYRVKVAQGYAELLTYIEAHNPGNVQDMMHIKSMFDNYNMTDSELFDVVVAKQEAMAKEFNIRLQN